jgi:uncharacterized membrane protein YeiH
VKPTTTIAFSEELTEHLIFFILAKPTKSYDAYNIISDALLLVFFKKSGNTEAVKHEARANITQK